MKALYTFFAVLTITFQALGQSDKSFEFESFEVSIKAVYAFMQDYKDAKGLSEIEEQGKALTLDFITNLNSDDSIALKQNQFEKILIDNGWGENGKKLYQKLLTERDKEIESGQDILRMLDNSKSRARANNNLGDNIISYNHWDALNEELGGVEQVEAKKVQDKPISNEQPISKIEQKKNEPIRILTWFGIVVLALILGVIIGVFLAKARFSDDLKMAKANPHIRKKLKDLESENMRLLQRISRLESKKNEFESRRFDSNTEKQSSNEEIIESKVNLDTVQQRITDNNPPKTPDQGLNQNSISLYFQYPEGNGSFQKDHGTSIKGDKSYFEIVYKEDHSEGELKFVADRNFYGKILSIRDTSLGPVSEIENPGEVDRPSNISVVENGIVEVKEDRFVIKEGHKLKIKIS
ncbi:MAG: hypothetical protein HWE07_14635 [Cytophagia bacterium]|nr:hypothetical protein [Cytophagia bacterium]